MIREAENSHIILQKPRHRALQNWKPSDKWVCLSKVSGQPCGERNGSSGANMDWVVSTKSSLTSFDILCTGTVSHLRCVTIFHVSIMTSFTNNCISWQRQKKAVKQSITGLQEGKKLLTFITLPVFTYSVHLCIHISSLFLLFLSFFCIRHPSFFTTYLSIYWLNYPNSSQSHIHGFNLVICDVV